MADKSATFRAWLDSLSDEEYARERAKMEGMSREARQAYGDSKADEFANRKSRKENLEDLDAELQIREKYKKDSEDDAPTLTDAQALGLAATSFDTLADVYEDILKNPDNWGPVDTAVNKVKKVTGFGDGANPTTVQRSREIALGQSVGKLLEGGKLTDADRDVYYGNTSALLPNNWDVEGDARAKAEELEKLLTRTWDGLVIGVENKYPGTRDKYQGKVDSAKARMEKARQKFGGVTGSEDEEVPADQVQYGR